MDPYEINHCCCGPATRSMFYVPLQQYTADTRIHIILRITPNLPSSRNPSSPALPPTRSAPLPPSLLPSLSCQTHTHTPSTLRAEAANPPPSSSSKQGLLGRMARTAFVALACGMLGAASALEVVTPSDGSVVVADRWAGRDEGGRHYLLYIFLCLFFAMISVSYGMVYMIV